jgi:hypothetical protein
MRRFLLVLFLAGFAFASTIQVSNDTIFATPQSIFYDGNGNINTLFFSNVSGVDYLNVVTISNNTITYNFTTPFNRSNYTQTLGVFWWLDKTIIVFQNASNRSIHLLTVPEGTITLGKNVNGTATTPYTPPRNNSNSLFMLNNVTPPVSGGFFPVSYGNTTGNKWLIMLFYQNGTITNTYLSVNLG